MRHLRWALLAAAAGLALSASPAVADDERHGSDRGIVAPSGSHDLTQIFKHFIELPFADNPLYGEGQDPCQRIDRDMLVAITFGEEVTCTAEVGTVVNTGGGHFCSTFDPVDSPWYATNPRDGRACARRVSIETGMRVSLDGGQPVDLFQPQYTAHTPPTTVRLPVDNAFGAPAGNAVFYGYGWHANLRNLRVGRHTYTTEVDVDGRTIAFPHVINIVPRGSLRD